MLEEVPIVYQLKQKQFQHNFCLIKPIQPFILYGPLLICIRAITKTVFQTMYRDIFYVSTATMLIILKVSLSIFVD